MGPTVPKLVLSTQIDTVHGESDGTPYHWRVWWSAVHPDGTVERAKLVRQGRCKNRIAARLMVSAWVRAASRVGPEGLVNPSDALRSKL
jgi:hypothetical protein